MATNDFKPFAVGSNANVISQTDYEALSALSSGFQAGKASSAQVNKALRQGTMIASVIAQFISDSTGSDVLDNGDHQQILSNLLLALSAEGSRLPVGVPVPWGSNTPPKGWIACSGQNITQDQYPKLFTIYGNKLPDLRGQFIRGWDNAANIDNGRAILSKQSHAMQPITAYFGIPGSTYSGAITRLSQTAAWMQIGSQTATDIWNMQFDSSRQTNTANETRPVNIAFNYIIKGE
ncbi:phage tail protein [Rosenbergiella epipactidis]|uniref:phage tail protein n=1 Tax=Rosenbergiella epipactidis TaxID=1544694 RepID=UPI001F4EBC13|nr:phage tail protein [Rosenbergiella epipactidis]